MSTTTEAKITPLVYVAIIVTILAWASAFIVIRGTGVHFSGGALALGRLAVGALLLGIVVAIGRRWVWPNRIEWLQLIGFGVLWFGAYNVALNIAEHTLDAGTTAMIVNLGPLLIAIGAAVFLREGLTTWLAVGAAVAFIGVILIGVSSGSTSWGDPGVFWALVAAFTYAAGVLLQKPTLRRLPNAQVTFMGAAIGLIVCLPFTGELLRDLQDAPASAVLGMVYLGAVPTALAFSTWAYALSRVPAGQLGISTYVVPPLAIIMGLIVFGEVPAPLAILGGAVCLIGVALSRRGSRVAARRASVSDRGKTVAE
ncbi:drug/metabolite transporter (DMT)-like permease [Microbacteriaceae bacterium SG_E_30_P1]|uniref:Drug/metabolite transporter (DMT)-like permease n=1 Tax=Antiquaquibacter oligotrophicus TaxID=2880260 RepID=A0ABT6KQQ6_9MICO|nr:DMT family transporter [Antiquaquibacter oligotrophicus]MDH6181437.1 drug/metabolite transporter (DMT)-like permease [Antiquaquibacter oligotrophicus]UDF12872.1 DMT family transporter [Antiquaquibacter oligotrophicus]